MTIDDEKKRNDSEICWIGNEKLDKTKVRDHCHITGRFRGAAHNQHNLKLKLSKKLPNIFHNLEGYDGHLIFMELNNFNVDIQVIPKRSEKYMSIIVNRNIVFLDSNQLYKGSLDSHASIFKDSDFKYIVSELGVDQLEIQKRKDTFSYDWVDSNEKFNYQQLPPKECFCSSLKDGKGDNSNGLISDEEYLHLENVWKEINFNTFRDFHNHYLKKDVLLLVDTFEKFLL